ncbi:MAG: hypothetical protein H7Y30_00285 [Pyrinomonadaceae bacterium]|nr:hypothetical protein [Pyrinomonadaceae bacterium]
MYQPKSLYLAPATKRLGPIVPISILFAIALAAGIFLLVFSSGLSNPFTDLYLLPWVGLVAVVVLAPTVYMAVRRRFDLFHPLTFAAWSYFFPAFVIGGLILASGLSKPFFLILIPDPETQLPLTLLYVALGYAGLTFGFAIPYAGRIGDFLSRHLPVWNWNARELLFPGVVMMILGIILSTSAFTVGIIGYQRVALIETFDATLASFAFFVPICSFLLWYSIFSVEHRTIEFKIVAGLLILLIPYSMLLSGARGSLIQNLLPIIMAFWLSGRRIKLRHGVIFGTLLALAVLFGIIYGTTFRLVKGAEEQIDADKYLSHSAEAVKIIANRGVGENLTFALETLSQRMETTSSLAVVVANYEQLESYAGDYGLAGNIWTYTWTAFIPRFVWPDKPVISDARAYSALYFDYGDNSFAITPIGDLLRNFGPIGVPIGMAILGFVLRIMYTSLIEGGRSVWRSAAYYLLLVNVSYESFYGTILPAILRLSLIILVCGFFISLMIRRRAA